MWRPRATGLESLRKISTSHALRQELNAASDTNSQGQSNTESQAIPATWTPTTRRTGVLARKLGMTALWQNGQRVPVTVLHLDECQVVDSISVPATKGSPARHALVLGCSRRKLKTTTAALRGLFSKAGVDPKMRLAEFAVTSDALVPVGTKLSAAHFVPGQHVDVQATTIGKGFQGVMKRHGFAGLRASHGTSVSHRSHGSTGQHQDPGRVFPGKKMAGRMGGDRVTTQNLLVHRIDNYHDVVYVKGAVPGAPGSFVRVTDALKKVGWAAALRARRGTAESDKQERASPPLEDAVPQNAAMDLDIVSVEDHDAFAHKHLSEMGEEVEDFQVFSWHIKDYRRQDKRVLSPEFVCAGHKWNILLFPMGNSNGQANDMVSVYLNYGDQKAAEGWHVCAQFALAISNPSDPTIYIQSQAHHRFTNEEQDWGFTRFVELRKLFSVSEGRPKPIIENDETIITAYVRVLKDPTGVLWHNFHNYDSKKETGYVGLKNQGATCYMNSLLQSLFLTNTFRKASFAVYQIPTQDDTSDTVPLALQRVFYNLQTSDQPVGTTELTKSFGWKGFDSFLQHDVQEFNRVLQDKLEEKMKGTSVDGEVKRLFSGTTKMFVKCIDIDFESARSEPFYDIQLNVKNLRNLEESFQDYIQVETLEGDNKYNAEGFGLQDARKGVAFESFPPVLHLQLKRFEYDMQRDQNVKINDRHEFPLEIDLSAYLDEKADRSESCLYKLHGVLVHSGDVHGGHYFALIKPSADGRWLRFDDDRVVPVTEREVLEDNFGGEPLVNGGHVQGKPPLKGAMKRFTNAYMLVYIRATKVQEILAPITTQEVPEHLRIRLDKERRDAEQRKRERDEQHLYLNVKLITEETFARHQGFDLATFDDRTVPATDLPSYRVMKSQPFVDFRNQVARQYGHAPEDVRLWVLVNRQNKTIRPDAPVPDTDPTLTMETVRDKMASRQHDLKLYLEYISPEIKSDWVKRHGNEPPIVIFVKNFDVAHQTLAGLGHFYVHRHMRVSDLALMINERMRFPATTPLRIYEEIKPNMIELMKMKATFLQSEIQDGDIVCFQVEMQESEAQDLDKQNMFTTPTQFYDFFLNRVVVSFKPKFEDPEPRQEFELCLSKKNSYDQMATKVAETLKHDPLKLRFTQANGPGGAPKTIVRRQGGMTVAELIQPGYMSSPSNLLYYELLDVSIIELETKKSLRITWVAPNNKEDGSHSFLLPKNTTIQDVAHDWLRKEVKLSSNGSGQIRLFEIVRGCVQRVLSGTDLVRDIPDSTELFAEEVPLEELQAEDGQRIVPVFHYSRDPTRAHGIPFKFVLLPGERFADTKKRLQARTGTSDKDLAKMKFSMIQNSQYSKPSPLKDEDVLYDHKWVEEDFIGLDHLDKRRGPAERGVFIRYMNVKWLQRAVLTSAMTVMSQLPTTDHSATVPTATAIVEKPL
ncbi:ubiquitin-specific protease ubp15 [Microbotryomycetes sp. JL221]|nr:ubiquitin-specific protease ubp15 [Microbotryomycetes sp. JL221]